MAIGNVISLLYDSYQLYDHGIIDYFSSFYNWFDFGYIWAGVAFIVISFNISIIVYELSKSGKKAY